MNLTAQPNNTERRIYMKKTTNHRKTKLLAMLTALCLVLSILPITAFAGDTELTSAKIDIDANFSAGDSPMAAASITEDGAKYKIAYECWREIEREDEYTTFTKRYWYSDAEMAAGLSEDEKFSTFEKGKEYEYDICLESDEGYVFAKDINISGVVNGIPFTNEFGQEESTNKLVLWAELRYKMTPVSNLKIYDTISNYKAGAAPESSAFVLADDEINADVSYECWEEMQDNGSGELMPVKFWYSDPEMNNAFASDKKITAFEAGKRYMYSLMLKAVNGKYFDANTTVTFKDKTVNASNTSVSRDGKTLFATALATFTPAEKHCIDTLNVSGVTLNFKDGDKPVFTATVPEGAPYYIDHEGWICDDGGITSSEYWNERYGDHEGSWGKLVTAFDANKTYGYRIYFKLTPDGYKANYIFGESTKLVINGQSIDLSQCGCSLDSDGEVYWIDTNLEMTPSKSGNENDYQIINGAHSQITAGNGSALTVRANGSFEKFIGVKVDGVTVAPENYTAKEGSTIITLASSFLEKLGAGRHTITVLFTDGNCSTDFELLSSHENQNGSGNQGGSNQNGGSQNNNNNNNGSNQNGNQKGSGNSNRGTSGKSPSTGSNFKATAFAMMLFLSCITAAAAIPAAKKRRNS